jgi:hypothetical protein
MLLSENNVKSELGYAYLHAIAACAGLACEYAPRHADGDGVDAILRANEKFSPESKIKRFTAEVQLKSTSSTPTEVNGHYSFGMRVAHYDKARCTDSLSPRLVVVLFLPKEREEWLVHSTEGLIAKRCAYWVSLYGAPMSTNRVAETIYIPKSNALSVEELRSLMTRLSCLERIHYASP